MSVSQVRSVLGDPAARLIGNPPDVPLECCAYLDSAGLPSGLGLMFANGRLVRIDIYERGIRTASGAEVGDVEEKIRRLYAISAEPHHYVPNGHYLRYTPRGVADRGIGIVFETDGAKVTSYRVGTLDAIALVEGCS